MTKKVIDELREYLEDKILDSIYRRYAEVAEKLRQEVRQEQQEEEELIERKSQEISCEDLKMIGGKVYYVIGEKYFDMVRKKERKLDHPPIYFKKGECEEYLRQIGITGEGIYLVEKGKVLARVYNL